MVLEVRRAGGFEGPVTIASTSLYFEAFDENGLDPDPSKATSDSERVIWQFDTPEKGDTFTVSFDARIEPGQQLKRVAATTAVLEGGAPVVSGSLRDRGDALMELVIRATLAYFSCGW